MTDKSKTITIICPVYNEQEAIPIFHARLAEALAEVRKKYAVELIFTNNASTDKTLETIKNLRKEDPSIQVITLSRNFGYQASLLSGLRNSRGDAVVIIDVDCEDPPELIPRFIAEWEKGYDIVYGRRDKRPEFIGVQLARKAFYRITKSIADHDFILDMAEFSLISARVRDAIFHNRSTFPFIRAELGYVGFKRIGIPYARERRVGGRTHYNFIGMFKFAVGGILSSSTFPLRVAAYIGLPLVAANLLFLLYALWTGGQAGYRYLLLIDFSYVILIISFLATYLARTYKDGMQRPLFIIDWENTYLNNQRATDRDGGAA